MLVGDALRSQREREPPFWREADATDGRLLGVQNWTFGTGRRHVSSARFSMFTGGNLGSDEVPPA
jgi:hypothetical protein